MFRKYLDTHGLAMLTHKIIHVTFVVLHTSPDNGGLHQWVKQNSLPSLALHSRRRQTIKKTRVKNRISLTLAARLCGDTAWTPWGDVNLEGALLAPTSSCSLTSPQLPHSSVLLVPHSLLCSVVSCKFIYWEMRVTFCFQSLSSIQWQIKFEQPVI